MGDSEDTCSFAPDDDDDDDDDNDEEGGQGLLWVATVELMATAARCVGVRSLCDSISIAAVAVGWGTL